MSEKQKLEELLKHHQDLYRKILNLFKKDDKALAWLTRPKAPLCGETPISLIHNAKGKERVMDVLYRIETGDLS